MIYLDNAATTRPDEGCVKAAEKYLLTEFYNPSAPYAEGYALQLELKESRRKIVSLIANENDYTLLFTSCGSESDNHAIFCCGKRGNIVTTLGEHSAIKSAVNEQKQRGIEIRYANLNSDGSVNKGHLLSLIDEKTSLVSVIHVNNETGAINDIADIAAEVKAINNYTLFHSDGVQAFGKIPFRLTKNIDLYSASAHKIGGLKGCAALFKKKNLNIKPYIYGGGQENGLRSGTENVFGIKCFEYAALKKYAEIETNYEKITRINRIFRETLDKNLFKVISSDKCSPYILSVIADGVRGETILHEADDNGVIIGTGSACSSNQKKRYSGVILACGIKEKEADGVLRISFSPENTEEEVKKAADIINKIVNNRKEIMA